MGGESTPYELSMAGRDEDDPRVRPAAMRSAATRPRAGRRRAPATEPGRLVTAGAVEQHEHRQVRVRPRCRTGPTPGAPWHDPARRCPRWSIRTLTGRGARVARDHHRDEPRTPRPRPRPRPHGPRQRPAATRRRDATRPRRAGGAAVICQSRFRGDEGALLRARRRAAWRASGSPRRRGRRPT